MPGRKQWAYEHSLLLVPLGLAVLMLAGQAATGWHVYNHDRVAAGAAAVGFGRYLTSGHFVEATFENWESEFLQMGLYVVLTIWLRQRGSSESKPLDEPAEVDREPRASRPGAPWPVRRGGLALWLYRRSLSLVLFALFLGCFVLHAVGGAAVKGLSATAYVETAQFWFESLQNWQSEMISIVAIVGLSVTLRQQGSPESKPVDAPSSETEA